ncbi:MAG: multicopper oxidase domain-containing protein, partial [Pseudomonadales bacterium]|nr:multicopper oxidase domain-containing protein [Pseudomonadales bacterium]
MRTCLLVLSLSMLFSGNVLSAVVSYELEINSKTINVTGESVEALAVAGQIPAPTLSATVGDTLRATFHNRLDEATSVHWHGILLPNDQDGVPVLNTAPIPPGGSFTFEFPILHAGTYWYHSHTDLQIQRGVYGALVFHEAEAERSMPEEVVVFSDWTNEAPGAVLANLKKDDDYYAFKKDSVQSWDRVIASGSQAISNRLQSNLQRMPPMDLADVGYDAFLVNGARTNRIVPEAGSESVKLRLVNGSTSSYYDIEYAGGPMTIVAADGLDVEPIRVQRLRISTAETYDVLVPLPASQAFELRATSIDGSGHSSLYLGEGEPQAAPTIPPPNLFLASHAGMEMQGSMPGMMHSAAESSHDHGGHDGHGQSAHETFPVGTPGEMHGERPGVIAHMTDYRHLRALESSALPADRPWRELPVTL